MSVQVFLKKQFKYFWKQDKESQTDLPGLKILWNLFCFLRNSSAPVYSGREIKFGRERKDEFCVRRWAASCKSVSVLQLNIAKTVFITAGCLNLGRKQNHSPLFYHYLLCSLNEAGVFRKEYIWALKTVLGCTQTGYLTKSIQPTLILSV